MTGSRETEGPRRRRVYLKMASLDEARERWLGAAGDLVRREPEVVTPLEALGRVTAAPVAARASSPHYCAAAMDGFAVKSQLTITATEAEPTVLSLPDDACAVNTGDPMPAGYDAVIMVEEVHQPSADTIEIMAAAPAWQHVRLLGEDMVASEMIVERGRRVSSADLAALLAGRAAEVPVVPRPRVAVLPTGSEVVTWGQPLGPGQVLDTNSHMLAALVEEWGGLAAIEPPTPDDPEALREALAHATAESDLVALIAGSSAGTEDFVPGLIEELGDLLVHGVRVGPGKPTALGVVNGTAVMGVPGYPVAAWIAFDLFAKPLMFRFQGMPAPQRTRIRAVVRRNVPSKSGTREYVRVRVARMGADLVAVPVKRGSGVISSLARAEGLAVIREMDEGVDSGAEVDVELLVPPEDAERTILMVGSHDIALDLLASHLAKRPDGFRLALVHVGSMGGLRALACGEAHLAGIHLLDPESGEYNIAYVRRVLGGLPLTLVNLAYREVGLLAPQGNPRQLASVVDLARPDTVMINRQRGAGTRVLLDHLLTQAGIDGHSIAGYGSEATTHMMVAAAVAGGTADVGLGIRAAAQAMDLDFVALAKERYDLAVPQEHLQTPGLREVREAMGSEAFREAVSALVGYDLSDSGRIMYEQ